MPMSDVDVVSISVLTSTSTVAVGCTKSDVTFEWRRLLRVGYVSQCGALPLSAAAYKVKAEAEAESESESMIGSEAAAVHVPGQKDRQGHKGEKRQEQYGLVAR